MLFNGLNGGRAHFRRKPFKLLVCSPTSTRRRGQGTGREGKEKERREEEITIKRFRLSFHAGFVEWPGSDCESLAEIFTTNFAQQFEPDRRSGRSINDQAPETERDCHVNM